MRWRALAVVPACAGILVAVQPASAGGSSFSPVTSFGTVTAPSLFNDATCPGESTCYLVGGSGPAGSATGIVTLTDDAGRSWQTIAVPGTGAAFAAIGCATPQQCVAVTAAGQAVTTGNGFATLAAHPAPSNLTSVACPSAAQCLAVGADAQFHGVVAASTDGGATWQTLSAPGDVGAVRCLDAQHCWAAGGGAWATDDLGATWTTISPPEPPSSCPSAPGTCIGSATWSLLTDIEFTSPSDGYVTGGDQCGGQTATQCAGALFHTADAGATWSLWQGSTTLPFGWQVHCVADACVYVTQAFHTSTVLEGAGSSWATLMTVSGQLNALACTPDGALCVIGGVAPGGATSVATLYSSVTPIRAGAPPAGGSNGTSPAATTTTVPAPSALQSTIGTTAATPAMVTASGSNALVDALVVLLLVLFITFPAHLFNRTWEENHDVISAWWARRAPRPRLWHGTDSTRRRAAFGTVLVVAAALGACLDPRVALDGRTALAALGVVLGLLAAVTVSALAGAASRRIRGESLRWHVHALPGALPIALGCVVVSRLAGFEPGYLYGVIGGVAFLSTLDSRRQGEEAAVAAMVTLGVAVVAWLAWSAVSTPVPAATAPAVLLQDVLATLFVSGLVGLVVGLVPLRFLPGERIARWNRPVWAVLFALSCFALLEIMLQPQSRASHVDGAPFWTAVGLFLGFGAASVAFWAWFRRRPSSA